MPAQPDFHKLPGNVPQDSIDGVVGHGFGGLLVIGAAGWKSP